MFLEYAQSILFAAIVFAIGFAAIRAIRSHLAERFPVSATGASVALVAVTLLMSAQFLGLDLVGLFPGLVAVVVFVGALSARQAPWSSPSILFALAASAGCIALIAALTLNYSAAALALLAAGVLVRLYCDVSPARHDSSETVRRSARAV